MNRTNEIPYRQWRDHIDRLTPADHRIGDDFLLVERDGDLALSTEPLRSDVTSVILLDEGWSRLRIDMVEYVVVAPAMIVIEADSVYQAVEVSEDMRVRVAVMSKSFVERLFGGYESSNLGELVKANPVVELGVQATVVRSYFGLLADVVRAPHRPFKLESARHLMISMLYGYLHGRGVSAASVESRSGRMYGRFCDLLRRHCHHSREVNFYAAQLGITPKYLSQIVKAESGLTAGECIDDWVITECKAMLSSTSLSVGIIASRMNFPSQSVFGKYFKRVTGLSPKEYRESLRVNLP